MRETIFFLTEGKYLLEDGVHVGYGIGCFENGKKTVFEDLSADREKVSAFVELCNNLRLSPIHLCDAVYDFLTDI